MLLQPLAPSQTEIFGFDPAVNQDPHGGELVLESRERPCIYLKDHVYIFSLTVQTGVCKIAQFMPLEPFHHPRHKQNFPCLVKEKTTSG